jgi:hypothetical protein
MIEIGKKTLAKVIARAEAVAEESWRRLVFDNPGMLAGAHPDAIDYIRDQAVIRMAERYIEELARQAHR